ncbi:MAG: Gfo/Idh/MocA family protein [Spirochaetota bacterium]
MTRIGIVGAGFMGRTHALNLLKIDGVEVAALVSHPVDQAEQLATEIGASIGTEPPAFGSFHQMLDSVPLDAVYFCVPPRTLGRMPIEAAEKGMHLFIEKPIAREIESQRSGKPVLFQATYLCNSLHAPWWRDRTLSGGQVVEQVIHLYDLAAYLFGEPSAVHGRTGNLCHADIEGYTVEDVSAGDLTWPGGAMGSICATNCAVPGRWDAIQTGRASRVPVESTLAGLVAALQVAGSS